MRVVSIILSMLIAFLLWSPSASTKPPQKSEELAQQSAEGWLGLVDSGKYAESWDETAELFKNAVTKEQWQQALKSTRAPLGKLQSRKLKSATYAKTLPGAPAGEYVVIQFDSSFENKKSAVETVTPMLDKDGRWHVSGYFIK
jgi:Protein of unknown function (DUF4019)